MLTPVDDQMLASLTGDGLGLSFFTWIQAQMEFWAAIPLRN